MICSSTCTCMRVQIRKKKILLWLVRTPTNVIFICLVFLLTKEKRTWLVRTQTNHIVFAYFVFSLRKSRASLDECLRTIYKQLDKTLANVANTSVQSLWCDKEICKYIYFCIHTFVSLTKSDRREHIFYKDTVTKRTLHVLVSVPLLPICLSSLLSWKPIPRDCHVLFSGTNWNA